MGRYALCLHCDTVLRLNARGSRVFCPPPTPRVESPFGTCQMENIENAAI